MCVDTVVLCCIEEKRDFYIAHIVYAIGTSVLDCRPSHNRRARVINYISL